jgi:hypothetical protein
MAIPTAPTSTSIVTAAYKDFGIASPTSAQITRAIDDGMEKVKRDLMNFGSTWKPLIKTGYIITRVGVSNYAVPTDYMKFLSCRIMEGTRTGTATAGSTTTITLAASDTGSEAATVGKTILITGGAGSGQAAQADDYNATTRVLTFDAALSTAVDATSTYLIADEFKKLEDETLFDMADLELPHLPGKPTRVYHVPDEIEGRLHTDYTSDKVYGLQLRYYADLRKIDLSSTHYATFLRLAADVLTQGVFVWMLHDDTRYKTELAVYEDKKQNFARRYLYGYDLSNMHMVTGEE